MTGSRDSLFLEFTAGSPVCDFILTVSSYAVKEQFINVLTFYNIILQKFVILTDLSKVLSQNRGYFFLVLALFPHFFPCQMIFV